ncbi:MAG: hypothetical protein JST84_01340 [Acidobacteria bacterium]|nr:hypothetical protein [Acidobacteriota bacterium]
MDWTNFQNAWGAPSSLSNEPTKTEELLSPDYLRLLDKLRAGETYWTFQQYADHIPQTTIDEALRCGDAIAEGKYAIKASAQLLARLQAEEAQSQMPAETLNQPESDEVAARGSIPIENSDPVQPSPRVFAAQWLRDLLQQEPRWVADIFALAKENGISIATLKRAKKSINAKSTKIGGYFGGEDTRWFWRLG